jgi:hypothetical protein
MAETPAFLAARLKAEGEKVESFFKSLSAEDWERTIYTEGATWKVRDILAHFLTAERGFIRLFKDILAGGTGVGTDFNIDRYNSSQQKKTRDLPHQQLIDQFRSTRSEMIGFVESLSDADLLIQGRHPFLGVTTMGEMIKMIYRHNQIHYRDIRKLIAE